LKPTAGITNGGARPAGHFLNFEVPDQVADLIAGAVAAGARSEAVAG
jgi:hypothetical protein